MEFFKPVIETQMRELRFCLELAPYCYKKTFVDVGADLGGATFLLEPFALDVVAIEPNGKLVEIIKTECLDRKINDKVTVLHSAAAEKSGEVEIFIAPFDFQLSSMFEENLSQRPFIGTDVNVVYEKQTVDAIAIDDLELDNVGAIKIDVEGFEGNVIQGAVETIARCRPAILWERSTALACTTNDVVNEILESMGYEHKIVNSYSGIHDDVLSVCK